MTRILGLLLIVVGLLGAAAIEVSYLVGNSKAGPPPQTTAKDPPAARLKAINAYWSRAKDAYPVPGLFAPRALAYRDMNALSINEKMTFNEEEERYFALLVPDLRGNTNAVLLVFGAAFLAGVLTLLRWPRLGGVVCFGGLFLLALASDPERALPPLLWLPAFTVLLFVFAPASEPKAHQGRTANAQALVASLRRRLATPVEVELSDAYLLNLRLGFIVLLPGLLYTLNARHFPRRFDAEGVTLRNGQRLAWADLIDVNAWRSAGGRGFLTGWNRLMLGFKGAPWVGWVDADLDGEGYDALFTEMFEAGRKRP